MPRNRPASRSCHPAPRLDQKSSRSSFLRVLRVFYVDGALYCYFPGWHLYPDDLLETQSIKDIDRVLAYSPRHLIQRIVNQGGVFTAHPRPSQPLGEAIVEQAEKYHFDPDTVDHFVKITIAADAKPEMLDVLDRYGISYVSLFPDLDGLSRHVNRHTLRNIGEKINRRSLNSQ